MHSFHESLLREAALGCIEDIESISARFLTELEREPAYARSSVAWSEVERAAVGCFEFQLLRLAGLNIPARFEGISAEVGRARARQGIPIDTVMGAVRADFRFLWNALLDQVPADALSKFAAEAVTVWEVVEIHATAVYGGYMTEIGRERAERENQRSAAFTRLLSTDDVDDFTARTAAPAMGLSVDDTLLVAVSPPDRGAELRQVAHRHGQTESVYTHDGVVGAVVRMPPNPTPPTWLIDAPCAIAPEAAGISDIPAKWRLARAMAAVISAETINAVTLRDVWPELLASVAGSVGEAIADMVFTPLASTTDNEVERLAETLSDYLDTGSTTRTAENIYRHRNTVIKRLDSFATKTSFDLTRPRDTAAITMALAVRPGLRPSPEH